MSKIIFSPAFSSEQLNQVASFQQYTVISTNNVSIDKCAVDASKEKISANNACYRHTLTPYRVILLFFIYLWSSK